MKVSGTNSFAWKRKNPFCLRRDFFIAFPGVPFIFDNVLNTGVCCIRVFYSKIFCFPDIFAKGFS